ncbi:hypothetical protein [Mesorhizobium salmacidum]|uniref:Uncharacterized protein n=1 Tax=Mesorhizobium salmacidum TaxID=3015171 RepID=A0ABU8L478_9HYPH
MMTSQRPAHSGFIGPLHQIMTRPEIKRVSGGIIFGDVPGRGVAGSAVVIGAFR